MISEPKIEDRSEQPYIAIRAQTTMQQLGATISQLIGETAAWLQQQGIALAGAPFVRYLVIDMAKLLEIEVGFPVAHALPGDEHIQPGTLPAGRYAALIYTDIDRGIPANKALLDWGAQQGLAWDQWAAENGDGWGGRIESFLTNPDEQPDRSKWETEVAIRLADSQRTVLSKDGTPIAFDQSGQGPALILVGGATATRQDAAALAAALAPHFTVFAYDRRGRGDSGDTAPYAVEREVEDIEALINAAGGAAFVFGHSSGAILALEAARLLPTHITKLAVYEPPFIIDDSRPPAPKDFAGHLSKLIASGQRGEAVEAFMIFVGTPAEMVAQMRQSPMWPGLEAIAPTLVYDITIIGDTESGDPSTLRKWASVSVPTLVMDGTVFLGREENHHFMRHGAQELTSILPHAQHRTLEGQDHGPAGDVLVPALQAFFLG